MKVYVAAKFEDAPWAKYMMELICKEGFEITHDWTKEFFEPPAEITQKFLEKCALDDAHGVANADVLVIYPHSQGKGQYTELGIALALHRPVISMGDAQNVFLQHPLVLHVSNVNEVIEKLKVLNWANQERYF